jgi:energy-coupling factor transporter ATP-binding protein EcfA2
MSVEISDNLLRLNILGTRLAIVLDDFGVEERKHLRALFSRCLQTSDDVFIDASLTPSKDLALNASHASGDGDIERVLADIVSGVTFAAIERANQDQLLVHAAALEIESSGEVVAFIAPSGVGKTTLARTLGTTNGYVTDETLAVNLENGSVTPYAKPLSVLVADSTVKKQFGPDELGLQEASEELHLSSVYYLERDEDSAHDGLVTSLDWIEAVGLLVPQISFLAKRQNPLKDLFKFIDWAGGVHRVTYKSAKSLQPLLQKGASSQHENRSPVELVEIDLGEVHPPALVLPGHALALRPQDAILADDKLVILNNDQVVVLESLAFAVWQEFIAGKEIAEATDSIIDEYGDPSLPRDLMSAKVTEILEALQSHGLLQVGVHQNTEG